MKYISSLHQLVLLGRVIPMLKIRRVVIGSNYGARYALVVLVRVQVHRLAVGLRGLIVSELIWVQHRAHKFGVVRFALLSVVSRLTWQIVVPVGKVGAVGVYLRGSQAVVSLLRLVVRVGLALALAEVLLNLRLLRLSHVAELVVADSGLRNIGRVVGTAQSIKVVSS